MALQQNSYGLNTNYSSNNSHIANGTNNNLNKNFALPLTIIPLTEDALIKQQQHLMRASASKSPDLTFHCMCCEEYFVNPFHMYEHLNTKHADLHEPQDSDEEIEDGKDYSWVFEPECELVADEEVGNAYRINGDDDSSSSSSESDSDDDSTSTSSSSTSSSSTTSSSNATTNTHDESTKDAIEVKRLTMDEATTVEVMEEAAYEEVEAASMQSDTRMNAIKLEPLDLRESSSTPVFVLNPAANTTITPVLPQVKRGRGRRSAAQQAAIEMSSLISGEPKCFQCTHCEASFPSAGDLSKHVRCHITNKPFQCSICDKTFTHIGSLNTHIRIHSGEKPYKCELCSKAFTQSSSLMVHVRSHSIKKPYQCHLCDKGFVNFTSLAIHLKTHSDGGPIFSCVECDKTFKQESQLNEHLRMHTLSLVYQCSICRMAFASSSELVQHMKCHMGEKPFTCSICDRAFTQSGSLNIHMRIHTGEKPFNCKFCNKSFTQASSLSVHLKIHSGDKPYPCHICGKSYSQAAYLNKHIQSHSDDQTSRLEPKMEQNETLLCIVCGELHRDANSLALHVTQKHAALLNNMQGQANNRPKMNITDEEMLKQEQMYMQQIQMLMQMQHQMIKHPLPVLRQTIAMPTTNPDSMISEPLQMEEGEVVDGERNDVHDDGEGIGTEEHDSEATKGRETLPVQIPANGDHSVFNNSNIVKQDSSYIKIENRQYLKTEQSSNDSPPVYNTNLNENTLTSNTYPHEDNGMYHRYDAEVDYVEGTSRQNNSNERRPMYYSNENVKTSRINTNTADYNGMDHIPNGSPNQQARKGEDWTNVHRPLCGNNKTMFICNTNSGEYSDDSQLPAPIYSRNEHEMTKNHSGCDGLSSPEYEHVTEEDNTNYATTPSAVVHHRHQSANVELHNASTYENDGVDIEAVQQHENQSTYSGNNGIISDINGDIEMSNYPFMDETKFNFYDDYAAEEEVETAE